MKHKSGTTRHLTRAAITIATGLTLLLATASAAGATVNRQAKITQHFEFADVQFTDCPTSTTVEMTCLGTDVAVSSLTGKVGQQRTNSKDVRVGVVTVHLHPDGTFDIDPTPIAQGQGPGQFHIDGLQHARIRADVPLDDNTVAHVDVSLDRAGTVQTNDFAGDFPVAECPSGTGHVNVHQRFRDASARGSATIHGTVEVPTSALQAPFLLQEDDDGNCLP